MSIETIELFNSASLCFKRKKRCLLFFLSLCLVQPSVGQSKVDNEKQKMVEFIMRNKEVNTVGGQRERIEDVPVIQKSFFKNKFISVGVFRLSGAHFYRHIYLISSSNVTLLKGSDFFKGKQ